MKKTLSKIACFVLTGMAAILVALANAGAASACIMWHHQPELPQALRKF